LYEVKERTIFTLVIVTLIVLTAGYIVGTNLDLMPEAASSRARLVDQLTQILIGISTVVFLVVEGALVYAVIRFRKKKGDEADAVPFHGNNTLELVWTIIPAFIVVFISFYSFQVLADIERPATDELVVEVIGRQFVWEFRYPDYDLTTQELRLPVDKQVRFEITSADVIHSFWVPEFRAKRDATPGQISDLVVTPTEIGIYPIRCAELCGAGHAAMNAQVYVETESDFLAWIDLKISAADSPIESSEDAQEDLPAESAEVVEVTIDGRELFLSLGCGACHVLTDASTSGVLGPNMDGFSETAANRVLGQDAVSYTKESLVDPNAFIVEGYPPGIMPQNFGDRLSVEEIEALITYLLNQ
jgi:cytochrome c oxidase subunit 2